MDSSSSGQEYVSCPWIEGGLVFGLGVFHVCCIAHHSSGGWMPIGPFDDTSSLDLDRVLAVRDEMRRANQGGGHERCVGCVNLQRQRWLSPYVFHTLNFSHFTQCNLRCIYCYLQRSDVLAATGMRRFSALPVLRAMVEQNLLSPDAVVHWGGGEPTLLNDFGEYLELLTGHGCRSIVNTNGTIYSAALCNALRKGTAFVTCSIDAGTQATYARLKGRDVFQQVFWNLERYACLAPYRVAAKYLFTAENLEPLDLSGFVDAIRRHGIRQIVCDIDEGLRELPVGMAEAIAHVLHLGQQYGIAVNLGGCGALRIPEFRLREQVAVALKTKFQWAEEDAATLTA